MNGNQQKNKNLSFLFIMFLVGIVFIYLMKEQPDSSSNIYYSEFLQLLNDKTIQWQEVQIQGQQIQAQFTIDASKLSKTKQKLYALKYKKYISQKNTESSTLENQSKATVYDIESYSPSEIGYPFIEELHRRGIEFKSEPPSNNYLMTILTNTLPWLIILGIFWFLMFRQIQGSGNKALSFGRSRAKLVRPEQKKITFDEVAGLEETKQELVETVEFLKHPDKFRRLGARIPRGVLLVGPPGTGKTLLARAVSGEADRPFFSMSGSEFVEMFVGIGASRVRDLFEQGKKNSPCIIFIDELDAVGRVRGAGYGGGHDEREQTLNQMLVEMDGFDSDKTIIIIAATNRPDVLDQALLRPGRFDRHIMVGLPDIKGREAILNLHLKKIPFDDNLNVRTIARSTPGFSGADLANLVNEAALIAGRYNKTIVQMEDLEYAKDKVLMGPERRSIFISNEEKENTAYHEAGHALLAYLLTSVSDLHKVSIIPRGNALGVTQTLPKEDRLTMTKISMKEQMIVLFGGRIGEELRFGKDQITNGASNDIEKATKIAHSMICDWGMSDALGPVSFGKKENPIFIGRDIEQRHDYSEKTSQIIDEEIQKLLKEAHDKARDMLIENREKYEELAQELLKKESLNFEEVKNILN